MKETIVILHGWGLTGDRFAGLAREFSKLGYRVFSPDLPGFGQEKIPPRPFSLTDYAEFLFNFCKKNQVFRAILVGHSFGGRIALKFNELYPEHVAALVLSGTPGFTPVSREKLAVVIALAKIFGLVFKIPPFSFFEGPVRLWYYYVVGAKEFLRAEGTMRQTFKNIVREELVSSMRAVRCPTVLIWGRQDIIIPLAIAERMLGQIKNSKLKVVDGTDHGLPFRQPKKFVQVADEFLRTI